MVLSQEKICLFWINIPAFDMKFQCNWFELTTIFKKKLKNNLNNNPID